MGQTQMMSGGRKVINYTATALDGLPIALTTLTGNPLPSGTPQNTQTQGQIGTYVESGEILVENAETQGLSLAVISLFTSVCEASEIQIIKTGDK